MPELLLPGERRRKGQFRQVMIIALFAGAIGGGIWYWRRGPVSMPVIALSPNAPVATPAPVGPPGVGVAPVPVPTAPGTPMVPAIPGSTAHAVPTAPGQTPALAPAAQGGMRTMSVTIDGPLERAIVASTGRDIGAALAQVVTRALVWWIDMPGDLKRQDQLQVVYEPQPVGEPIVHAVRFQSSKTGQVHRAYRFKMDGGSFYRMYQPTGEELEMRLQPAPLDDYEQVTSLIRDGRRHKGVDFKAPVGTPVRAVFNGTITRRNWNFRGNGNCLELTEANTGRKIFYLHLDVLPKTSTPGKRVSIGEVIANSGNTGHSFAPHLHYQLMAGDERVLDPFSVQKTSRRSLPATAMPALNKEIAKLDALLDGATAAAVR